jgi:hypothetical protein
MSAVAPFSVDFSFPPTDQFVTASPPHLDPAGSAFFADPFNQTSTTDSESATSDGFTFSGSGSADFTFANATFASFSEPALGAFPDQIDSEYREFVELIEGPGFRQTTIDPDAAFGRPDPTDSLEAALAFLRRPRTGGS